MSCRDDMEAIKECLDKYYESTVNDEYDIYSLLLDIERIIYK